MPIPFLDPSLVKPQFNTRQTQPFTLRPFTPFEEAILRSWCEFCRRGNGKGNISLSESSQESKFLKYLEKKHYDITMIDRYHHGPIKLFQNLYVHAPRISLIRALRRASGFSFHLTSQERVSAFREVVDHHRRLNGENTLPHFMDFREYNQQRLFLPITGIISPAPNVFRRESGKETGFDFEELYPYYFKVPEEISDELIIQNFSKRQLNDDLMIANYQDVHDWLKSIYPDDPNRWIPAVPDIDAYADKEGGLTWAQYCVWIQNRNGDSQDRSLQWLRRQVGLNESRKRTVKLPVKQWQPEEIISIFLKVWELQNPQGFKPRVYLADPPSVKTLEKVRKIQQEIIEEFGELRRAACEKRGVPSDVVPKFAAILVSYEGGYQKLLADIENQIGPRDRSGIVFTNNVQKSALVRFARQNGLNPDNTPTAVRMAITGR